MKKKRIHLLFELSCPDFMAVHEEAPRFQNRASLPSTSRPLGRVSPLRAGGHTLFRVMKADFRLTNRCVVPAIRQIATRLQRSYRFIIGREQDGGYSRDVARIDPTLAADDSRKDATPRAEHGRFLTRFIRQP
jgi:hypothetical protein